MAMPFGGTVTADDFESGTIAAAWGAPPPSSISPSSRTATSLPATLEQWWKKAEGKAVVDYAFHMVIRQWSDQIPADMDQLVKREGVTSFKIFMAYPGALMLDDASLFKAFQQTATNGGLICVHAENGGAIDVLVRQASGGRQRRPEAPHADPADHRRGRGHPPRHQARRDGRRARLLRPPELRRRARAGPRGAATGAPVHAETCPHYLFLTNGVRRLASRAPSTS